ncbi:hypothetical protein KI688_001118 [Linnemannia hyalina]|uniref:F-box domain-containing protein n=1 Tax=Linnemannia hyalina TaxID=64524 RepID=A0A9P7Y5S3_9FUNG|nr:hypothetical protein KI688_001118 [Linnemannia hyalina]
MPTSETTADLKVLPRAADPAATTNIPRKDKDKNLVSASRLAPEIVLLILSFLDYHDQPSSLCPILTLCKPWARLALELIYEQPVLTLKSLPSFSITLGLQDRLRNGQTPFWETNIHLDGRKCLGIDYRSLIKRPCRIVGTVAPTKQDLVQFWDLQALLWTVPALATAPVTMIGSPSLSTVAPYSSPPQSPLSPTSIEQSSTFSPTMAAPTPTTIEEQSSSVATPSPPRRSSSSSPSPSKAVLLRRKKKTLPPPGPVVMMLESTAAFSEIMHDVLREVPGMKLRHLHYRLIPGVSLSDLVRNHLSSLQELVISRSPTRLDDFMTIARLLSGNDNSNNSGDDTSDTNSSSQRQQQQHSQRSQIHRLALDRCQGAGMTALTELVRACGSHLRTLEFRQHTVIRPAGGDLAQFPLDAPGDWNAQEIAQEAFEKELAENPSMSTCEPGQACRQCASFADINSNSSNGKAHETRQDDRLEESVEDLSIASATITPAATNNGTAASTTGSIQPTPDHQQPLQQQQQQGAGIPPVGVDPETRMDLAMLMVSELCPRLTRLRLQNMTWLSDNSLAGFRPTFDHLHRSNKEDDGLAQQQHRGLKEIELLDSYYASQVTIEGLLELCGPDLETLVVDRRSCWRTRTRTHVADAQDTHTQPPGTATTTTTTTTTSTLSEQQAGLCVGCMNRERLRRFRDETMSTGDRIISGLISDTTTRTTRGQVSCSIRRQQVDEEENGRVQHQRRRQPRLPRLSTLMLIEHWVSVQVVKEALCEWSQTLAVVSLRLYKCSNQELEDALVPKEQGVRTNSGQGATALERLELSLPWIAPNETEKELSGLADKVFEAHASLSLVEINRRTWKRKASASSSSSTRAPSSPTSS